MVTQDSGTTSPLFFTNLGAWQYIIEDTRESLQGRFKVTRVDLATNSSLAMRYRVSTTPTLLLFKDGLIAATLTEEDFANFPALESKVLAYCEDAY